MCSFGRHIICLIFITNKWHWEGVKSILYNPYSLYIPNPLFDDEGMYRNAIRVLNHWRSTLWKIISIALGKPTWCNTKFWYRELKAFWDNRKQHDEFNFLNIHAFIVSIISNNWVVWPFANPTLVLHFLQCSKYFNNHVLFLSWTSLSCCIKQTTLKRSMVVFKYTRCYLMYIKDTLNSLRNVSI